MSDETSFGFPIRTVLIWGVIALVLVVGFAALQGPSVNARAPEISYSAFLDRVEAGELQSVTSEGDVLRAQTKAGQEFVTFLPAGAMPDTLRALRRADVEIRAVRRPQGPTLADILLGILPMLLLIGAWFFFMRQMQKKPPTSLGSSRGLKRHGTAGKSSASPAFDHKERALTTFIAPVFTAP